MINSNVNRRMGDGYEPHVDEIDGKLVYSIPVDSGFVSLSFEYEIDAQDLAVMLDQPYRRAVLHWVLHTRLQHSMIPGSPKVLQEAFRALASLILFSPLAEIAGLIEVTNRDHNIVLQFYIDADLKRLTGTIN